MSSSIFNQQLTIPLASDSVLNFLGQTSFWQDVWQASTITESGQFQIDLQTQLKLAFFSASLQITQSLPQPGHPCKAIAHWSDHQLALDYHVTSVSPTSSLLRFSVHLDKSSLIVQSQAKLILRHHWQSLVATLHEAQHEFLFQNLQSNSVSLSPQAITGQLDNNQSVNKSLLEKSINQSATNISEQSELDQIIDQSLAQSTQDSDTNQSQLTNDLKNDPNLQLPIDQLPAAKTQPSAASNHHLPSNSQQLSSSIQQPFTTSQLPTSSPQPSPLFTQPQLPTIPLPTHGFTLWRTVTDWQKAIKLIFTKEHLTSSQWLVLYFLVELSSDYPSLTASQLSKLTGLHKMVISDLAKQLVKKHYLRKLKLSHNKKEFQLQVTAAGKTSAFAVFGKLQQAEKHFFDNIAVKGSLVSSKLITPESHDKYDKLRS